MKLNMSVKIVISLTTTIVIIGVTYFSLWLPFWNFLNNESENLNSDDKPIFTGDILGNRTPSNHTTPGKTNGNNSTSKPTVPKFEEGSLNILLLGEDAFNVLTDTICVVNIDAVTKKIKMVSIPRDAYVPYTNSVREWMNRTGLTSKGRFKINASKYIGDHINYKGGEFESPGINFLCAIIEIMVGYKIDEYALVDFDGFIQLVDLFGGIQVTSKENMYNNKGELVINEGINNLDGTKALFYARARYRYDEYGNQLPSLGDIYRKENQLAMLVEVSKQIITPDRILQAPEIINTLRKYMFHSITVSDLSKYTPLALDYAEGKYTIETHAIWGENYDPPEDPDADYVKIY